MSFTDTKIFRRYLAPSYDELTLFALSFTTLLFLASQFSTVFGSGKFVLSSNGVTPVLVCLILAGGIILSLFHSFSRREKLRWEKQVMFLFAAFVNGFSGIWGSTYLFSRSQGFSWLLVFPAVNLVSSYIIFSDAKYRVLEEDCIDDRDVTPQEVALSAVIITAAFLITRYIREIHWSAAFSACVAYGTNLNRIIVNFLIPDRR